MKKCRIKEINLKDNEKYNNEFYKKLSSIL